MFENKFQLLEVKCTFYNWLNGMQNISKVTTYQSPGPISSSAAQTESSSSQYGVAEGPILLDNVKCSGDETSLLQCSKSPLTAGTDCDHTEDVAITCQGMHKCPFGLLWV